MAMVSRESQTTTCGEQVVTFVKEGEISDVGPYELVDVSDNSSCKEWDSVPTPGESGSDLGEEEIFDPGLEPLEGEKASEVTSLEMTFEPKGLKSCLKARNADGDSCCISRCVEFSSFVNCKYKRQYGGDPSELWVRANESRIPAKILVARASAKALKHASGRLPGPASSQN